MVHGRPLHFEVGPCGMEIAILLLLSAPFASAVPITSTQRVDPVPSGGPVDESRGAERARHAPAPQIVPFVPEESRQLWDALKQRMAPRPRPRRAPQRGCQLGTCQLHNLANTLYHISKTNGKDESKKANDPQGYGR